MEEYESVLNQAIMALQSRQCEKIKTAIISLQCLYLISPQSSNLANLLYVVTPTLHPFGSLDEALVGCGLRNDHLVVFPSVPVSFEEIAAYLLAKGRQILLDNFPYCIGVYLIIVVYQHMAHLGYKLPGSLGVFTAECACELIGCFADNLNALHYAVVSQIVGIKFIPRLEVRVAEDTVYCLNNMFQTVAVSNEVLS